MFWVFAVVSLPYDYAEVFHEVRMRCGLPLKTIASVMEIAETQLAQQIRGNGHVSHQKVQRLALDPLTRNFYQALEEELAVRVGLVPVDPLERLLELGKDIVGKARMAKAKLPEAVRREVA